MFNCGIVRLLRFIFCVCVGNYIGDYLLVFLVFGVELFFVKFVFSIGKLYVFEGIFVFVFLVYFINF